MDTTHFTKKDKQDEVNFVNIWATGRVPSRPPSFPPSLSLYLSHSLKGIEKVIWLWRVKLVNFKQQNVFLV